MSNQTYYYTKDRATINTPSMNTAQPTQASASASTSNKTPDSTSTSTSSEPPPDPKIEQYLAAQDSTGRWNTYKIKYSQNKRDKKSLATLPELIRTTVGTNLANYLFNEHVFT